MVMYCTNPECTNPACVEQRNNKDLFVARKVICDVCEWSYVGLNWENKPTDRCQRNGFYLESFTDIISSVCPVGKW